MVLVLMRWSVRLLGLLSTLVLARLLMPEDFGLVAIATAYFGIIEGVTNLNLSAALIRFRENDPRLYGTAWTLGLVRGTILSALMAATAWPVAGLMEDPRLLWVILALSIQPLINGFTNPYFIDYEKNLTYGRVFVVNVSGKISSTLSSVTFAIIYQSYWALVIGILVSASVKVVMSYLMRPKLPRLCLSATRKILGFTIWLSGNSLLTSINNNMYNFVIGKRLGAESTGLFHVAAQLAGFIKEFTTGPISQVMFSAFSQLSGDIVRLRNAYVKVTAVIMLVSLPACAGLAFVSQDFIRVVLGESWLEMAPYLSILSLLVAVQSIVSVSDQVAMSIGQTKAIFKRKAAQTLVIVLGLAVAYYLESLMAFVMVRFVSGVFYAVLSQQLVRSILGKQLGRELLRQTFRPLLGTVTMIGVLVALRPLLPLDGELTAVSIRLATDIAVGAATYAAVTFGLWCLHGCPAGAEQYLIQQVKSFGWFQRN